MNYNENSALGAGSNPYGQQPPPQSGYYPPPPPPPQSGYYNNQSNYDPESNITYGSSFGEVKIRHAFIKKVYGLVTFQLACTASFIALIKYVGPVTTFFVSNAWLLWVFLLGTFIIMLTLACCESVARSHPINLILLLAFTLMESVLVGCITIQYKTDTLFIAIGITAVVVIGLTLFAFQTKIDFTGMGTYLFVFGLVLFAFGLVSIILRSHIMNILYAALGAGLFSMYLVFDTQLMIGGKHKYSISPEDYIFAALNIYVDIINLFLLILRLVSASKD
jgi:FtsH-binding integral membrane protein